MKPKTETEKILMQKLIAAVKENRLLYQTLSFVSGGRIVKKIKIPEWLKNRGKMKTVLTIKNKDIQRENE